MKTEMMIYHTRIYKRLSLHSIEGIESMKAGYANNQERTRRTTAEKLLSEKRLQEIVY